jgi:hypothetical protein
LIIFPYSPAKNLAGELSREVKLKLIFMKKILLTAVGLMSVAGLAHASNLFSYTATAAPGSTPDGVDQNNNPLNIWTVTLTPPTVSGGGEGVYEGTAFSGDLSGWQEYSYPGSGGPGSSGSVDAVNTFAGGALAIGQTLSLNFEMRAVDNTPNSTVGVSLLNGSGNAITFGIFGGEPDASAPYTGNGYYYTDAGTSYGSAGSMGYQYQSEFNIAFTVTGADTYSAVAGSDSWSGTFNGSLTGIDVFNHDAGNASDVGFNNLTVAVPEPGVVGLASVGGALLLGYRRRK